MYVAKVEFRCSDSIDSDLLYERIDSLLHALRQNGQTCGREYPIAITLDGVMAMVMLPAADALDESHHNSYVRRDIARFCEIEVNGPYFSLIGEDMAGEVCECLSPSSYILYTYYVALDSPLRCGDCFDPIPLYRIPPTYEDEYYNIICWQSDYQSCDSLQMNCRTLERAATRQISDPSSSLSQQGRALCQQIEALTGKPAYYHLYRSTGRRRSAELKRVCPACDQPWLLDQPWHRFDFKCEPCRLVSTLGSA
jgi:predicted  nucleic acid-binding Zn ribbon protein